MYATFGVQEYWLVDPERETIVVQALRDGVFVSIPIENGIARSLVLPGFAIAVTDVFATPEWSRQS